MSDKRKRYILPEEEIPHYWYNIQADMVNKPMPPLHPGTKQPLKAEDLYPIFAKELCHQELNQTDAWIEIPEDVREMYKYYRSTPLVREAHQCKETGEEKVILFNLSGHGLIDMASYDKYLAGDLVNYALTDEDIQKNLDEIGDLSK